MRISLDSECTGLELYHKARPFIVTACFEGGDQKLWRWDVDPLTREVDVLAEDVEEIQKLVDEASEIVFHNSKYDITALGMIGIDVDWKKVRDTLTAGHILASKEPHNLTAMGIQYVGVDIQHFENDVRAAVLHARRYVSKRYPEWRIAKEHGEDTPSASKEIWRNDYWLPKALAVAETDEYGEDHPYHTVVEDYANGDSDLTFHLWPVVERELKRLDLWEVYLAKMAVIPVAHKMEKRGVTYSKVALERKLKEYVIESDQMGKVCAGIAKEYNYDIELPKSGRNKSLNNFVFNVLALEPMLGKVSEKTGEPSFDAEVKEHYELSLPKNTLPHKFIKSLNKKASLDTAISYLSGYGRYGIQKYGDSAEDFECHCGYTRYNGHCKDCGWDINRDTHVLHSNINTTGTAHTRWSIQNPNTQNISKQSEHNLREIFGPGPGREWWSPDADNIELRLSAYAADETELIEVFENPDRAPYFGSYHLVVFDALHPELFRKFGVKVKDPEKEGGFASTWYQWVKNGNFAIQYGAQESKADLTYQVKGAFRKIKNRFPKIALLNEKKVAEAERHGFVETMRDKRHKSRRGYPMQCARGRWGKVVPTTPFNYYISGSAGIWMQSALVRCDEQLETWRKKERFDGHIIMNVHDEIVFDMPKGKTMETNLPKMRVLQALMEKGGEDVGIPTPVSLEYNPDTWAKGVKVCRATTVEPVSIGNKSRSKVMGNVPA